MARYGIKPDSVAPDPGTSYAVPSATQIQSNVQRFMATGHIQGSTVNVFCIYASGPPSPNLAICPAGATQTTDAILKMDDNLNPFYTKVQVTVP
jgi:hypothetical protein